jgi:hypothetical protein
VRCFRGVVTSCVTLAPLAFGFEFVFSVLLCILLVLILFCTLDQDIVELQVLYERHEMVPKKGKQGASWDDVAFLQVARCSESTE